MRSRIRTFLFLLTALALAFASLSPALADDALPPDVTADIAGLKGMQGARGLPY